MDCFIKMLKDVLVKMCDGIIIYIDIYLLIIEEKVFIFIVWSFYGKSVGIVFWYKNLFNMLGMGNVWNFGFIKFEVFDLVYWCVYGYVVCNFDMCGIVYSEGNIIMIGF